MIYFPRYFFSSTSVIVSTFDFIFQAPSGRYNFEHRRKMKTRSIGKQRRESKATAVKSLARRPRKSIRIENGKPAAYKFRRTRTRCARSTEPGKNVDACSRSRETNPEDYPDLDFHHTFGSFLTRKNPVSKSTHPAIAGYWDVLSHSPSQL